MTRTFESGPAVLPDGPLADPPETIEHRPAHIQPSAPEEPEQIRLMVSGKQITVAVLANLLQEAIAGCPRVADFAVEAEGCDCVGEAVGIRVDFKLGIVLVARNGWQR